MLPAGSVDGKGGRCRAGDRPGGLRRSTYSRVAGDDRRVIGGLDAERSRRASKRSKLLVHFNALARLDD
jgi:hypothetical protein